MTKSWFLLSGKEKHFHYKSREEGDFTTNLVGWFLLTLTGVLLGSTEINSTAGIKQFNYFPGIRQGAVRCCKVLCNTIPNMHTNYKISCSCQVATSTSFTDIAKPHSATSVYTLLCDFYFRTNH